MKNMKIKGKLIASFSIILVLMLISTILSFMSLNAVYSQVERYRDDALPNTVHVWTVRRYNISLQRYMALLTLADNDESRQKYLDKISSEQAGLDAELEILRQYHGASEETITKLDDIMRISSNCQDQMIALISSGTTQAAISAKSMLINNYIPNATQVGDVVNEIASNISDNMVQLNEQANRTRAISAILLFGSLALTLILSIIIIVNITRSISKPVDEIERAYEEIANGNIINTNIAYSSKDELGRMADSIRKANARITAYIQDISEKLNMLSQGNMCLEIDLDYAGDFVNIKEALINTSIALSETMKTINISAEQVNSGADQVSSASQALAAGAAEQASTIEELSSSVSNVSHQAEENLASVRSATEYMLQVNREVEDGNTQMQSLNSAMTDISEASQQISNITKVIEDIAFQTNILALNAAVEAARAGSAGAGFAVVADEVRNLAGKSATAAKQTADLIQRSVSTVAEGEKLTEKTARSLQGVADKAELVNQSMKKIEISSSEQASMIEQITQGLSQVSSVVQTNAATAEESSAASEELAAQAQTLKEEMTKFKLSDKDGNCSCLQDENTEPSAADEMPDNEIKDFNQSSSKY